MCQPKRPIDALHDLREAVATWAKQPQTPQTDADIDLLIAWWQCYPDAYEQGFLPPDFDRTTFRRECIAKLEQKRAELHGASLT